MKNFRIYQLAVKFYKECEKLKMPGHLKDQLMRASSSVVLNLAEGAAKPTKKDQRRFYFISLGSLRECQAVLDLRGESDLILADLADHVGASLYRLAHC